MKKTFLVSLLFIQISYILAQVDINKVTQARGGNNLNGAELYFIDILNEYRAKNNLNPVIYTDKLYEWSYDQSYYLAYLNKTRFQSGNFDYIFSHTQDYDLPNWEEQDRPIKPIKYIVVGENVAFYWEETVYPKLPKWNNQKEIAEFFLKEWISSPSHNELLLLKESEVISINFYKMKVFMAKRKGVTYNIEIITATLNTGIF